MTLKKALPLALTAAAICPLFNNAYANDWPVYAPHGVYIIAEAGVGFITNNKLKGFNPVTIDKTLYAKPAQKMSGVMAEHLAIGDYLMNPDSITAIGLELGFNHFSKLNSNVTNSIHGNTTSGTQQTTAWSTTLDAIASFNIIGDSVAFFGKLGLGYAHIKRDFSITTVLPTTVDKSNNSSIGVSGGMGLRFALNKNIAFRVEADGFTGESHASYLTGLAGIEIDF